MRKNSLFKDLAQATPMENMLAIETRLSLESEAMHHFAKTVVDVIPRMVESATTFFNHLKTQYVKPNDMVHTNFIGQSDYTPKEDSHELIVRLHKAKYTELDHIEVFVPEGFQGNLANYATLLRKSADHACGILAKVINPYTAYLSSLISSKDAAKDGHEQLDWLTPIDAARDELNKYIAAHFNHGSTQTRIPMGDVISRLADWEVVLNELNAGIRALDAMGNTTVQKGVDTCVELLEAIKQGARSGHFDHISPANLRALSSSTLSIAREVEFFAITRQRLKVMMVAVDDTASFFKTVL